MRTKIKELKPYSKLDPVQGKVFLHANYGNRRQLAHPFLYFYKKKTKITHKGLKIIEKQINI